MLENAGKMQTRITQNTDTFYVLATELAINFYGYSMVSTFTVTLNNNIEPLNWQPLASTRAQLSIAYLKFLSFSRLSI